MALRTYCKGLTDYSKRIVADLLARMGCDTETKTEANNKKVHDELTGIFSRVLDAYISDYPTGNICDKYVVSHVVKAIVNSGLEELSDQLKTVYSKDMVEISGSARKDGTYKGKGYLKEMTLIYPELTTNLSKPKKFIPIRQISTDES